MPRHEFFARGSRAAMFDGTISISSPTATTLQDKIVCFFADIKTPTSFQLEKIIASTNGKSTEPTRNIQIQIASDLKVN
jgi:hypothetical protein